MWDRSTRCACNFFTAECVIVYVRGGGPVVSQHPAYPIPGGRQQQESSLHRMVNKDRCFVCDSETIPYKNAISLCLLISVSSTEALIGKEAP